MVENVPEEHVRMGVAGAHEDGGHSCTCGWGSPEHVRLGVAGARSPASRGGTGAARPCLRWGQWKGCDTEWGSTVGEKIMLQKTCCLRTV